MSEFGRRAVRALPLLVFMVSAACADAPPRRAEGLTAPSNQILFDGEGAGRKGEQHDHAIFAVNEDGTELTRLSPEGISATEPAWSSDHSKIAFQSDLADPGNTDIYVMSAVGTDVTRLTTNPAIDSGPAWAPDGQRIVFERSDDEGHLDLYFIDVDSFVETRLTDAKAVTGHPTWSPDGRLVAFARNVGGDANIYTVDVESGVESQLTSGGPFDSHPAWSPDGSLIAFDRSTDGDGQSDIWVMGADGSAPRPLLETPVDEHSPIWSPDGKRLLFISRPEFIAAEPARNLIPSAEVIPTGLAANPSPRAIDGVVPLFSVSW